MRTLLAGERTTIQASRVAHHLKVEVQNASAAWIDYSSYVIGCSWGEDIDQPVGTASIQLRRKNGAGVSLAPLVTASTLNVDGGGFYAPALDVGRLVRISTATLTPGSVPIAGDYREVFSGRIDTVAWESDPVSLECSDLGAWLQDTQIELLDQEYGTTPGTALETVIQNILNDSPSGVGAVPTLYTPTSPSYLVTTWTQGRVKVLEGVRTIAQQSTGWDVRFRYDSAHVSRLTLTNPDRSRVSVDTTIGPTEYRDVRRLSLAIADIRNAGLVPYTDASGVAQTYAAVDSTSISKYGRRYFELPSNESIDTLGEATTLLTAVLHDLSGSPADQEIDCLYFWPVQLYDRYTFTQNGDHYDQDQTLAVVGYRHDFTGGQGITTIRTVDRVVGAYADWLRGISTKPTLVPDLLNIERTDDLVALTATFSWERASGVHEIWAAYRTVTAPQVDGDWASVAAALAPLADGVDAYAVPMPADGQVVLVLLVPYDWDLSQGSAVKIVVTATPQVPHVELDDLETTTTGTQWWKITERGIAVSTVTVQTQVGTDPVSAWVSPTRSAGGASTVRGGTLGTGEYEHDVTLDTSRQSWIMPRITLVNGAAPIVLGPFGFDRDKRPNLTVPVVSGTKVYVLGDIDTRSVGLASNTRAWSITQDGSSATFDIALSDTIGTAGLGAGVSDTFTATGYSDPISATTGSTLSDTRTVVVGNGAAAGASAWDIVSAAAPVAESSAAIVISLRATAAPGGWTVKVYASDPALPVVFVDKTATVSPAAGAVPTVTTTYTYTAAKTKNTTTGTLRTVYIKADLLNAGVVSESRTVPVSYYANP